MRISILYMGRIAHVLLNIYVSGKDVCGGGFGVRISRMGKEIAT